MSDDAQLVPPAGDEQDLAPVPNGTDGAASRPHISEAVLDAANAVSRYYNDLLTRHSRASGPL